MEAEEKMMDQEERIAWRTYAAAAINALMPDIERLDKDYPSPEAMKKIIVSVSNAAAAVAIAMLDRERKVESYGGFVYDREADFDSAEAKKVRQQLDADEPV